MLTTLLKPRKRGANLGSASRSRYVRPRAPFVVAPGQVSTRGVRSGEFTLLDGGTVDNRQEPGVALNRRWPSQAEVITRQISQPRVYTNRWETPPAPPPIRSTGFLLALQVKPGKPPPPPPKKDEYDTYYIPLVAAPPPGTPTFYSGLRVYYKGAVYELALVALADQATGMGGVPRIQKNGTTYAIYLVETTDPNASNVRIKTTTGVKSIRLKT